MNKEELIKLKESLLANKSTLYILCNNDEYGNFDEAKTLEEINSIINTESLIQWIEQVFEQTTIYIAKKAKDINKIELSIDYRLFISKDSLTQAKKDGIIHPKSITNITKNDIVNDVIEVFPRILSVSYINLDGEMKIFETELEDKLKTPIKLFITKTSELKQYIEKLGYEIKIECPGFKFMKNIIPNYEHNENPTMFDIVCDFTKENKKTK